ncbi:MAG: hypothetical protein IJ503_03300 [Akkermansia sp.]|nr:hypothetical protein [Akkermansia sp.]
MTSLYITITVLILIVLFSLWVAVYLFHRAIDLNPDYDTKESLARQIAEAHQTLEQTRKELNELSAELVKARNVISESDAAKDWLEKNRGTIESLKIQIAATQTDLDIVTKKYNNAVQELQNINTQLQEAQSKLDSCYWLCKSTENQRIEEERRFQQLQEDVAKLNAAIADANTEVARLDREITKKTQELNSIDGQRSEAERRLAECEARKDEVEKEIREAKENAEKDIAKAEENKAKIEEKIKELNETISSLEKTRNSLKAKVSELEFELSSYTGKENVLAKKWEDLDREIKIINISNPKKYGQQEWLGEFESALKESGFEFSSRLIKAFHTSLKVADYSPMVVLAGISGTGKSLLPELYAHAVGMNFLQIPVQPRWDSPQDMLGFYNYMEGRYKATELSRLLWQTDCYNNRDKAPKNPGMNLILLDEMNLARVEYYFSDMLSKLEVRRGLDPANEAKRRAAEIVLESGAMGGTDALRRIFVGRHNLFVGTMNEDESTQSLSDKVKDRANVLRFGRPKNLIKVNGNEFADRKDKKATFFELFKDRAMTFDFWQEWQNDSNRNAVDVEMKKIAEVNDMLARIGRPFAHRLWNTTEAYILQYPGSARDALIDQLEMKIMPRLNGLDLSESFVSSEVEHLGIWVDELGDDVLSDAFKRSKEDREFFMWQGTERDS